MNYAYERVDTDIQQTDGQEQFFSDVEAPVGNIVGGGTVVFVLLAGAAVFLLFRKR